MGIAQCSTGNVELVCARPRKCFRNHTQRLARRILHCHAKGSTVNIGYLTRHLHRHISTGEKVRDILRLYTERDVRIPNYSYITLANATPWTFLIDFSDRVRSGRRSNAACLFKSWIGINLIDRISVRRGWRRHHEKPICNFTRASILWLHHIAAISSRGSFEHLSIFRRLRPHGSGTAAIKFADFIAPFVDHYLVRIYIREISSKHTKNTS